MNAKAKKVLQILFEMDGFGFVEEDSKEKSVWFTINPIAIVVWALILTVFASFFGPYLSSGG